MSGRFVIGIDLGTSNSALAYADVEASRAAGRPLVEELPVPQLIGPPVEWILGLGARFLSLFG